jgi:TPR repeat protein
MGIFSRKKVATAEQAQSAFDDGRFADAATLFKVAAATGDANAQLRLAQLYEHGQGVLQSFVDAVQCYRSAAAQGTVLA